MTRHSPGHANAPAGQGQGDAGERLATALLTSIVPTAGNTGQSPVGRILPEIASGTPKRAPGTFVFDTRSGGLSVESDPDRRNRPLGGLLPKAGNTSQRAARRAMARAERDGRRAYHAEGARLAAVFAAAERAEGGTA